MKLYWMICTHVPSSEVLTKQSNETISTLFSSAEGSVSCSPQIDRPTILTMEMPPEVSAEFDRLAKICRPNQDLRADFDGHKWSVYLKPSAPLVENPQTEDQMTTYLKHMVRSGVIDIERVFKENNDGQKISFERLLTQYSDLDF